MKIRVVNKSDFKDIYNLVKESFKTAQVSDGKALLIAPLCVDLAYRNQGLAVN